MKQKKRPAIFLDRDGVLIVEKNFLVDPADIEFFPQTISALTAIKSDYLKIVISNQSGIARGYFSAADVDRIDSELSTRLNGHGIFIDSWYYCPHGPEDNCSCRKPGTGMITSAARELNIDLAASWMIGDKTSDIEAGKKTGLRTILVKTGYGGAEPEALNVTPDYTAPDILGAIEYINRSLF